MTAPSPSASQIYWAHLRALAPDAVSLLSAFSLRYVPASLTPRAPPAAGADAWLTSSTSTHEKLVDRVGNGLSPQQAACEWLQDNREARALSRRRPAPVCVERRLSPRLRCRTQVWEPWVPPPPACTEADIAAHTHSCGLWSAGRPLMFEWRRASNASPAQPANCVGGVGLPRPLTIPCDGPSLGSWVTATSIALAVVLAPVALHAALLLLVFVPCAPRERWPATLRHAHLPRFRLRSFALAAVGMVVLLASVSGSGAVPLAIARAAAATWCSLPSPFSSFSLARRHSLCGLETTPATPLWPPSRTASSSSRRPYCARQPLSDGTSWRLWPVSSAGSMPCGRVPRGSTHRRASPLRLTSPRRAGLTKPAYDLPTWRARPPWLDTPRPLSTGLPPQGSTQPPGRGPPTPPRAVPAVHGLHGRRPAAVWTLTSCPR